MEGEEEKVCVGVAIGNDVEDGIGTLEWVLKKWPPNSLSILILYSVHNNNMGKVYTPCKYLCLFSSFISIPFLFLFGWISFTISLLCIAVGVGKLPKRCVNDEKVENLRKSEQLKIDKTLTKYIAFCGKVGWFVVC